MRKSLMVVLCTILLSLSSVDVASAQLVCTNNSMPACTDASECMFCEHESGVAATIGLACATDADCAPAGPELGFCDSVGNNPGLPCSDNRDCVPNGGQGAGSCLAATCTDIGDCLPQLNVEMEFFSAMLGDDNRIWLTWETSSETNNAGFEIQLSLDNQIFVPIDFVDGFGTTETSKNYSFQMNPEASGVHFIRLKQVDFDGAFEFTDVIEVETDVPGSFKMYPSYPNPFNPSTKIQFVVSESLETRLTIFDSMGQEIETLYQGVPEPGINQVVEFDGRNLSSGTYYIKLITPIGSEIRTISLIK